MHASSIGAAYNNLCTACCVQYTHKHAFDVRMYSRASLRLRTSTYPTLVYIEVHSVCVSAMVTHVRCTLCAASHIHTTRSTMWVQCVAIKHRHRTCQSAGVCACTTYCVCTTFQCIQTTILCRGKRFEGVCAAAFVRRNCASYIRTYTLAAKPQAEWP